MIKRKSITTDLEKLGIQIHFNDSVGLIPENFKIKTTLWLFIRQQFHQIIQN